MVMSIPQTFNHTNVRKQFYSFKRGVRLTQSKSQTIETAKLDSLLKCGHRLFNHHNE